MEAVVEVVAVVEVEDTGQEDGAAVEGKEEEEEDPGANLPVKLLPADGDSE